MTQASLWQAEKVSADYAELCNALYERELTNYAELEVGNVTSLQSRLKSLPHYIKRTAHVMSQVYSPCTLDVQNASWIAHQGNKMPLTGQEQAWQWYWSFDVPLGLTVPVFYQEQVHLDAVDRIDLSGNRIRTNAFGWMTNNNCGVNESFDQAANTAVLLRPLKKIMMSACAGHRWHFNKKAQPQPLTLRELLLSCNINWRNFRQPIRLIE